MIIILIYLHLIAASASIDFKLSDSKILLPRTSYLFVNYTIYGSSNICHEWTSSAPEVITVVPVISHQSCSQSAIITSVWQSNSRATATIYSKNVATGHVVKCDVIVDIINKLDIETRTLQLYLHETPEALIAKGYDEFGNTFSTLDGIPFEWSINSTNKDYHNVLRFITWTESEYKTPLLIGKLEEQGLQGYMQLVSGLKTGSANVTLTYRDDKILSRILTSDSVKLLVMANAVLSPQLAYLIPHTELKYKIIVHSHGSHEEVKLPNTQYYLNVSDTKIAELQGKSSIITALKYGQTEVILMDRNIYEEFRHPTSLIYVKEPSFLSFYISPGENQWTLQSQFNNTYVITVRPFDFNSHALYMSDNLRLETIIPKEYFKTTFSTMNGTYHIVEAIKEGSTTLKSKLSYILLKNGKRHELSSPVEGSQDVVIYSPIKVDPQKLILPWCYQVSNVPGLKLNASGGSGEYKWFTSSDNPSIEVDNKGLVRPLKLGENSIIAADQRNLRNQGSSLIQVVPIASMEFILGRVEVEINKNLDLDIALYDKSHRHISHCHWLPFEASLEDSNNKIVKINPNIKPTDNVKSCAKLSITGLSAGFINIILHLNLQSNTTNTEESSPSSPSLVSDVKLSSSITISAYFPARFIDPESGHTSVAIKSQRLIQLTRGPLPWILSPNSYSYQLLNYDKSPLSRSINKLKLQHQYITLDDSSGSTGTNGVVVSLLLQCLDLGDFDIQLALGNKPSVKNPLPVSSLVSFKLSCVIPQRMKLIPQLMSSNSTHNCPYRNFTGFKNHLTINNKQSLPVQVVFYDKYNNIIDKSESISIDIQLKSVASHDQAPLYLLSDIINPVQPLVKYTPNKPTDKNTFISFFELSPKSPGESIGDIYITVQSTGLRNDRFSSYKFNLQAELQVKFSRSMLVIPSHILIYTNMHVHTSFAITHGSGYFQVNDWTPKSLLISQMSDSINRNMSEVIYKISIPSIGSASGEINTLSNNIQMNKRGFISIRDLCFNNIIGDDVQQISLELIQPVRVQILALNKVEIGQELHFVLKVFDESDREFPKQYMDKLVFNLLINGQLVSKSDVGNPLQILHVVHSSASLGNLDWLNMISAEDVLTGRTVHKQGYIFKLLAQQLGTVTVVVELIEASQRDVHIQSNSIAIEVFPPLQIVPKQLNLLPGAEYQLITHDGPLDQSDQSQFSLVNKTQSIDLTLCNDCPRGLVRANKPSLHPIEITVFISAIDPVTAQLKIISQDYGVINVVQIRSMSIHVATHKLLVGNTEPLWATFTTTGSNRNSEIITGMSFTGHMFDQLGFSWNLNPPMNVLAELNSVLMMSDFNTGVDLDERYLHSGMRLKGLKAGIQTIELTARGIPSIWLAKSSSANNKLHAKITVDIMTKLDLLLNSNQKISESNIYQSLLLPLNTRFPLVTTLDTSAVHLSYKLHQISSHLTTVNQSIHASILAPNILQTTSHSETILVEITSSSSSHLSSASASSASTIKTHTSQSHTNQSILLVVEIKPPTYLMLNPLSQWHIPARYLPLGGPYNFVLTAHDQYGSIFHVTTTSTSTSLSLVRQHRTDQLSIECTSMPHNIYLIQCRVQALKPGDNTLQLTTDLLSLPTQTVVQSIPPAELLSVHLAGTRVLFINPMGVASSTETAGSWHSTQSDVISVHPLSGMAYLMKQGSATIYYLLPSSNMLLAQSITVQWPKQIQMSYNQNKHLQLHQQQHVSLNENDIISMLIPISFYSDSSYTRSYLSAIDLYSTKSLINNSYNSAALSIDRLIDDSSHFNWSQLNSTETYPLECSVHLLDDSSNSNNHWLSQLLDISVVPVTSQVVDYSIALRQWACLIQPKTHALPMNLIQSFIANVPTNGISEDWQLMVKSRLHNQMESNNLNQVTMVVGYVLLGDQQHNKQQPIILNKQGQVYSELKLLLVGNSNMRGRISVKSNKPNLLEVLSPRIQTDATSSDELSSDSRHTSHIWVYPLKVAILDKKKSIDERILIQISLPQTGQKDDVHFRLVLHKGGKSSIDIEETFSTSDNLSANKQSATINNTESEQSSTFNWLQPLSVVFITAVIAVTIVLIVNYLLASSSKPSTINKPAVLSSSPLMYNQQHHYAHPNINNSSNSSNFLNRRTIPPATTSHIWTNQTVSPNVSFNKSSGSTSNAFNTNRFGEATKSSPTFTRRSPSNFHWMK